MRWTDKLAKLADEQEEARRAGMLHFWLPHHNWDRSEVRLYGDRLLATAPDPESEELLD